VLLCLSGGLQCAAWDVNDDARDRSWNVRTGSGYAPYMRPFPSLPVDARCRYRWNLPRLRDAPCRQRTHSRSLICAQPLHKYHLGLDIFHPWDVLWHAAVFGMADVAQVLLAAGATDLVQAAAAGDITALLTAETPQHERFARCGWPPSTAGWTLSISCGRRDTGGRSRC